MYFSDAFVKVIKENSKTIVLDSKLIDLIESYDGFNEFPEVKNVLIAMQSEGYAKRLASNQSNQKDFAEIAMALYDKYSFNPGNINRVLAVFQYHLPDNDITTCDELNFDDSWTDEQGVKYSIDKKLLLKANESLISYKVLPETKIICKGAFSGCFNLQSICFPEGLTHIGEDAFYYCQNLSSISFANSIKYIGDCAFSNCSMLSSLTLPEKLSYLGSHAFSSCTKIETITIPSTLEHIGDYAFEDCYKIKSLSLPHNLSFLGRNPFSGCRELKKIDCNSNNYKIVDHTIYDKTGELLICYFGEDEEIVLPDGLIYIGVMAFERKRQIKKISLPNSIKFIANYALRYCSSISEIIFPSNLKWIGEQAFNGCRQINHVEFSGNLRVICDTAFGSLDSLEKIELPEGLEVLDHGAFFLCKNLRFVKLPNTLKHIENVVFYGCDSLKSINLPQGLQSIGEDTFKGCDLLSSIIIPDGSLEYFEDLLSSSHKNQLIENDNYNANQNKDDTNNEFRIKSLQRIEDELISEFTIDSMMGGQKEIPHPDYSNDPYIRKLQKEYTHRCLSTKKFLLSDKAIPRLSNGIIAQQVKQKIYDYACDMNNRNCEPMHYLYIGNEINRLAQQISTLVHFTLFEQTIGGISIEDNYDLTLDTDYVSARIASYVLFTMIVNENMQIDSYDMLFVQSWFCYFEHWRERDNCFLRSFNNKKREYAGILWS